jgi:hypothetical protein
MCIGPPSSDEFADQVNEIRNDEEEEFEVFLYMDNVGHHLWDHCLHCES